MNLSLVRRSLVGAVIAHVCGLLVLAVLGFFCWKSSDPDRFSLWLGVISLAIGALVCGLLVHMSGIGLAGALLSAAGYILPMVIGSFFNVSDAALSMPVRYGIIAACAGIIIVLGALGRASSDGRRRKRRRASVRRSVERRFG